MASTFVCLIISSQPGPVAKKQFGSGWRQCFLGGQQGTKGEPNKPNKGRA